MNAQTPGLPGVFFVRGRQVAEKAFDLKPETQVNKNIKMYNNNNGGSKKE